MANDVISPGADTAPLLRTLAPALRGLQRSLRAWLDAPHSYPLSAISRATLEGLANDLHRQSDALDVDRPLLVVMLMGGTGVGKSTLLNALAGGNIAQASFTRPTTRDPVVYYHESIKPERLDPALRHCRLAPHDRPGLQHKIIVDTPDLDSNDLANRDKLEHVLPVADVVLYVGSQEKYHDKLGWDLFLKQRKRRAFAFVLNKWDRCLHALNSGMRPDEDLLRDLNSEGFASPLLFRTCAQQWLNAAGAVAGGEWRVAGEDKDGSSPTTHHSPPATLPEGEQFLDLVRWLEMGLTRLEIEAIKARGVSQLLTHLEQALRAAAPPELTEVAERTKAAWGKPLTEEAATASGVLLDTVEPYQKEIEHHFALEGQRRFHGLMAAYLRFTTRWRYGSALARWRVPLMPRLTTARAEPTPAAWDLANFTRACSDVAGNRHLDARIKALANRLLVDADTQGFPLNILSEPVESRTALDWRQRYSQILVEVLHQVEQEWTQPKGFRLIMQSVVIFLANWLPPLALLGGILILLWRIIDPAGKGYSFSIWDVSLPFIVLLAVLVLLHVVITLLLPFRWAKIRGEFARKLEIRLKQELENVYEPIPGEIAAALRTERRQVEKLMSEVGEVSSWLQAREKSASIEGLYGH
jgi:hypothetical protein